MVCMCVSEGGGGGGTGDDYLLLPSHTPVCSSKEDAR